MIVTKYDRLARSLKEVLETVETTCERGAGFLLGRRQRERISERTKEGLASARKRGRVGGRLSALTTVQKDEVRWMRDAESRAISEIARLFGVSERTVRRA